MCVVINTRSADAVTLTQTSSQHSFCLAWHKIWYEERWPDDFHVIGKFQSAYFLQSTWLAVTLDTLEFQLILNGQYVQFFFGASLVFGCLQLVLAKNVVANFTFQAFHGQHGENIKEILQFQIQSESSKNEKSLFLVCLGKIETVH